MPNGPDIFDAMDRANAEAPPQDDAPVSAVPKGSALPDIFKAMDDANAAYQGVANATAPGAGPDAVAKSVAVARSSGVSQPFAEQNPQVADQVNQQQQVASLLGQNPKLARFSADNPLAARMAADDFQNMDFLSKVTAALGSGVRSAAQENAMGRAGNIVQLAAAAGVGAPESEAQIQALSDQLATVPTLQGGWAFAQTIAHFTAGLLDNAQYAAAGALAGAAVGAPEGGVGAAPGALIGGGFAMKADMARINAGNEYLRMRAMRGADGQPLSEAAMQFGAAATGAASFVLFGIGGAELGATSREAVEAAASKAVQQAVMKPAFTQAIAKTAATWAGQTIKSTLVMGTAVEGANILAEEFAKAVSPGHFDTDPTQIEQRLVDATVSAAVTFGALHGLHAGMGLYGDWQAAQRAEQHAQMFQNLMAGAAESKLRDRSLDDFQSFMHDQADGTPVENLFIPAAKVRELYQSARAEPGENDPLFGFVKDMPEQMRQAEPVNGDIVIPTADYVAHLAGTPLAEKMLPDIRVGADSMSVNEAQEFAKVYQERTEAAMDQADKGAEASPHDQISREVTAQAQLAGYSPTVARQYGELYAARYTARGERLGIDPYEAYQQAGLTISTGRPEPGEMRQAALPKADDEHIATLPPDAQETLRGMYGEAAKAKTKLDGAMHDIAETMPGARVKVADLKGTERAVAKIKSDYKGDPSQIKDLARGTIVAPNMAAAVRAVDAIRAKFPVTGKERNAFAPGAEVPKDGYRDAKLNVVIDGHVAEIQVTVPEMDAAKDANHSAYKEREALEREIADSGKPPTAAQSAKVKSLNAKMLKAYKTAWEAAKAREALESESANSALDTAVPLRLAEPGSKDLGGESSQAAQYGTAGSVEPSVTGMPSTSKNSSDIATSKPSIPEIGANVKGRELPQDERGSIRFTDGRALIKLFSKADASTLVHESGHAWVEELLADAARPDAPDGVKDDAQTLRDFVGSTGGELTTEQHETLARGFERYLMEGKAPSRGLATAFSRFKNWLTRIYQTVANLHSPITPEVRGVFDRLLATDNEIAEAQRNQGLEPLFKDRAEAGMTEAEWGAYLRAHDNAKAAAEGTLLDKAMAAIRKQRGAEYKEQEAPVRAEVAKEVDARQDVKALELVTKGKRPDGTEGDPMKITTESARTLLDPAEIADLPRGSLAKAPDGEHPDNIAEILGYPSGEAMMRDLINLNRKQNEIRATEGERRGIRQYLIDTETDSRMKAKYGDILDDGSMRDEAMAAVHSEQQERLAALELRYLNRQAAGGYGVKGLEAKGELRNREQQRLATKESVNVSKQLLDRMAQHADAIMNGKTVDELGGYAKYGRDERRAAREVQDAVAKGDFAAAAAAKQRQLLAGILFRHGREASEQVERGRAMMQRLASKKTFERIDQGYTDQIHALLERFGMKTARDPDELDRAVGTTGLSDFLEEQYKQGYEFPVSPTVLHGSGDVANLRLPEFRDLMNFVQTMQAAGRETNTITVMGKAFDRGEAIFDMVNSIKENLGERKVQAMLLEDRNILARAAAKTASFLRSVNAALLKKEGMFDWMDGGKLDGPFNRMIFQPLKDAQFREQAMKTESVEDWNKLRDLVAKDWHSHLADRVATDLIDPKTGQPFVRNRKWMLSIALNWGTQDSATKLADGYKWDERNVQAFLDKNMTADDWRFVQGVWSMFEKYKDPMDQLSRRLTGVGLTMVPERVVSTKFGDIQGKYYPLAYDASTSIVAERNLERSKNQLFDDQYHRPTPNNGSMKARVKGVRQPVQLSLDVAPWKLNQTIHSLAFHEPLMQAFKLLSDRRVIDAMDQAKWIGPEVRKTFIPWLQTVANANNIRDDALAFSDKFLNAARRNVTMVGIGFRVSTMLKHGSTALSNSIGEIGPKYMLQGTREAFGTQENGQSTLRWAMANSGELRNRMNHYDRDLSSNVTDWVNDSKLHVANVKIQEYSHMGVAMLDFGSALPTWVGAVRKAQDAGLSDDEAYKAADKAVRNAHGAQGIVDRAAFQDTQSQLYKLTGMFYGFFNHIYNRQMNTAKIAAGIPGQIRAGNFRGGVNDFSTVLARTMTYLIVPALIEALVSSGGPNEDKGEGWWGWGAKAVAAEIPAGVPILRDIAKASLEGHDYEVSPVSRAVKTIEGSRRDIAGDLDIGDKAPNPKQLQHMLETVGYLFGAPLGQPAATAQFLWDYGEGNQDPQTFADWFNGLTKGRIPQEH